jgi:uncharacterized protein (DUF1330 family)
MLGWLVAAVTFDGGLVMKTYYAVGLGMLAGFGMGAVAIEGIRAQAKPPVYYVAEIDVANEEGYAKEYVPKAQALIRASGGKLVAIGGAAGGGKVTVIEGTPPKRAVVQVWESLEKIQAWRDSAEWKEHRKVGDKYAKFRAYAVEGAAQ